MKPLLDRAHAMDRLMGCIAAAGGQSSFARKIGVSRAYLNDVVHGHRHLGPKILAAIQLREVIRYEHAERAES